MLYNMDPFKDIPSGPLSPELWLRLNQEFHRKREVWEREQHETERLTKIANDIGLRSSKAVPL